MSVADVLAVLEGELNSAPVRGPSEDLYQQMLLVGSRVVTLQRADLVGALRSWLEVRTEPRTMIGISLAEGLGLTELREDLDQLRADIVAGRAFLPHYVRWVDEALGKLQR